MSETPTTFAIHEEQLLQFRPNLLGLTDTQFAAHLDDLRSGRKSLWTSDTPRLLADNEARLTVCQRCNVVYRVGPLPDGSVISAFILEPVAGYPTPSGPFCCGCAEAEIKDAVLRRRRVNRREDLPAGPASVDALPALEPFRDAVTAELRRPDPRLHQAERSNYREAYLVRRASGFTAATPALQQLLALAGRPAEAVIKLVKLAEGGYARSELTHVDLDQERDVMDRVNQEVVGYKRLEGPLFPASYLVAYAMRAGGRGRIFPAGVLVQEFLLHETIKDFRRGLKPYLDAGNPRAEQLRQRASEELHAFLTAADAMFRRLRLRYGDLHLRNLGLRLRLHGQPATLDEYLHDPSVANERADFHYCFFEAGGASFGHVGGLPGDISYALDRDRFAYL